MEAIVWPPPPMSLEELKEIFDAANKELLEPHMPTSDVHFGKVIREFIVVAPSDPDRKKKLLGRKIDKTRGMPQDDTWVRKDENHSIEPGEKYKINLVLVTQQEMTISCFRFLREQNSLFTGEGGLSLLQELKLGDLPSDAPIVSFDVNLNAFWFQDNFDLPYYKKYGDGEAGFPRSWFLIDWKRGTYLLSISKI